jgi:outer membrane protein assembly factor BamB
LKRQFPFFKSRWLVVVTLSMLSLLLIACTGDEGSWPGIAADDTTDGEFVIVSYRRQVIKFGADGDRDWTYNGEDDTDFYAPAYIDEENGLVYVGDYKGRVHAVDLDNGEGVWTWEEERTQFLFITIGSTDRVIAPITVSDEKDRLFFGNEHGIHSLRIDGRDRESNDLEWSYETGHSVWAQPFYLSTSVSCGEDEKRLSIEDSLLIVTSLDKHMYAFDPTNGDVIWRTNLDGAATNRPAFDCQNERLYVSTLSSEVLAVDLKGNIVDRFKAKGWVWGSPYLHDWDDNIFIYFGDLAGNLYGLEITDEGFGKDWSYEIDSEGAAFRAMPLVVPYNETYRLIIGSENGRIYAYELKLEGSEENFDWVIDKKWEKSYEEEAFANLVLVYDDDEARVVTGTNDESNLVVSLRLRDGDSRRLYEYDD